MDEVDACFRPSPWHAHVQEKDRLAKEVTELNETVFSRSFKAPSAWAEREVKYKAEKRDWSSNVQRLQTTIERLREENLGYRAANKAAEFESQMKVGCRGRPGCAELQCVRSKSMPWLHVWLFDGLVVAGIVHSSRCRQFTGLGFSLAGLH